MWLSKKILHGFREARFCTERRILRLRVAVAGDYERLAPKAAKLSGAELGELDTFVQFGNVTVELFHALPVGETSMSYVVRKVSAQHPARAISRKCFLENLNELD